ncbi:hypothetical protein [Clostridioides difficile]
MDDFSKLKSLYEDGYRCIYHDCVDNNYTIYLKILYGRFRNHRIK